MSQGGYVQRTTFHRFGHTEYVETGSTGTNLVAYGVSECGAGIFTLDEPYLGVVKYIAVDSSDFSVQCNTSAVTFNGSTLNRINATTDLDRGELITLIGKSTTVWYVTDITSSGLAFAAATNV